MSHLTAAQSLWLRSTFQNAIRQQEGLLRFRLQPDAESPAFVIYESEEGHQPFSQQTADQQTPVHIDRESLPERLLTTLDEQEAVVAIETAQQTVLYTIRQGKVERAVEERQPPLLQTAAWAVGKSTHLHPQKAAPLLQAIGLMTAEGEIKAPMRKKFKQVNHFLDLMQPILKTMPAKQAIQLVDCGCGKSYLGFVLFWYIRNVLGRPAHFLGIDVSEPLIQECRQRAKQLCLPDMRFQCGAIEEAQLSQPPDLLVSLHACDTATDEALALGIAHEAKHIVAVPCCQHEIARQLAGIPGYPIERHSLFKHRLADLLTDMCRSLFLEAHGYKVTVGEFVSVEETPKNLMLKASAGDGPDAERMQQFEAFKQRYGIQPSLEGYYLLMRSSLGQAG